MKWKIEKKITAVFLILLAIALAGCGKKEDKSEDVITGTDGLVINFVENFPQDKYVISPGEQQSFTVVIDIKNKGTNSLEAELIDNPNYAAEKKVLEDGIKAIEDKITELEGEITTIEDEIEGVTEIVRIAAAANAKKELEEQIKTKNLEKAEMQNDISALKPKIPKSGGPLEDANLFIGGFDRGIINMGKTLEPLFDKLLPAASPLNPNGGFDSVEFSGELIANNLEVNKYEPTILATACYPYTTKAGPNVCIDPNPFDTKQEKVCTLGSHALTSQGAPIAVTKIDQEASSKRLRFKITIKNAGNGDVISLGSLSKCSSTTNLLKREDFDLVELSSIKAGTVDLLAACGPFAKQGTHLIRLFDGEGFVVCTVDTSDASRLGSTSAYLTPLIIELKYGYRNTVLKQVSIRKLE